MNDLVARMAALGPTAGPDARLQELLRVFEAESGTPLIRPIDTPSRQVVQEWLKGRDDAALLVARRPVPKYLAHTSLARKASAIASARCMACDPYPDLDQDGGLLVSVAINVDPWSFQTRTTHTRIKNAVKDQLVGRNHLSPWNSTPLCMSVVALLPKGGHAKDTDNLTKGILDSLTGVLYEDDKKVQCLSARQVKYAGSDGAYFIRAVSVWPWDADVVLDDAVSPNIVWDRINPPAARPGP